jgi:hypothetical protein
MLFCGERSHLLLRAFKLNFGRQLVSLGDVDSGWIHWAARILAEQGTASLRLRLSRLDRPQSRGMTDDGGRSARLSRQSHTRLSI